MFPQYDHLGQITDEYRNHRGLTLTDVIAKTLEPVLHTTRVTPQRLASLWLDLGEAKVAFELVDKTLARDPEETEAYALLERLVKLPEPAPTSSSLPGFGTPGGAIPCSAMSKRPPRGIALSTARKIRRARSSSQSCKMCLRM